MKLPPRITVGVQQLGRQSPEAIISAGRAVSGAISSLAAPFEQYQSRKDESQEREARLAMSNSMVEFENKYGGRDFYSADEIPSDIEVRRTEKVAQADGTVLETARAQIPAYEVYPSLYRKFASSSNEAASSLIDNEKLRKQWSTENTIRANTGYSNRAVAANAKQEEFVQKQLASQIQNTIDGGDYNGAKILAEDIADENLRATTIKVIDRTRELDYADSLLLGGAETDEDLVAIEAEINRLRDPESASTLSDVERAAKADALEKASAEHEMSLVERRKREDAQIVSDMWMRIDSSDPRADSANIQQLFDDGLISGGEMTAMKRSIANNHRKALEKSAIEYDLDTIARSSYGVDPKNKNLRDAVNDRYDSYLEANGNDRNQAAIRIMQEFKVVPEALAGRFRSANRADANGLRESAELWIKAEDYAPQSLSDFNDNEVDVVRRTAANIRLGMTPADAVEQVRRYENMTPQQKAALKEQSKTIKENNTAALVAMANDQESYKLPYGWVPFAKGVPDVPAFMSAEFDAKVNRYLPQVGYQLPVAQRMAFTDITKDWQRTDINGEWRLMKNAPQAPTEQIRSLVAEQYGQDSGITILSDSLTQLQLDNGKPVTYQAFRVIDPDTQEIEILPRFKWDAAAAANARRDSILKEAERNRNNRLRTPSEDVQAMERRMGAMR